MQRAGGRRGCGEQPRRHAVRRRVPADEPLGPVPAGTRRHRHQHPEPDGPAHLPRTVEQPGRHPRLRRPTPYVAAVPNGTKHMPMPTEATADGPRAESQNPPSTATATANGSP